MIIEWRSSPFSPEQGSANGTRYPRSRDLEDGAISTLQKPICPSPKITWRSTRALLRRFMRLALKRTEIERKNRTHFLKVHGVPLVLSS